MKKLSTLLTLRRALLQQARLANLAFAYATMQQFAARIARAQLVGRVVVKDAAPQAERFCASLTALDMNQSVIEEHFTDEEVMELADVIGFIHPEAVTDVTFDVGDVGELFLTPLREELERQGIVLDQSRSAVGEPRQHE